MSRHRGFPPALLLCVLLCGACGDQWDRSLDPEGDGPHGTAMLPRLLQAYYPGASYEALERGFGESRNEALVAMASAGQAGDLYVAIGPALAYDSVAVAALTDFVEAGGSALLAGGELSVALSRAVIPGECLDDAYNLYFSHDVDSGDTLRSSRGDVDTLHTVTRIRGADEYYASLRIPVRCPERVNVLLEVSRQPLYDHPVAVDIEEVIYDTLAYEEDTGPLDDGDDGEPAGDADFWDEDEYVYESEDVLGDEYRAEAAQEGAGKAILMEVPLGEGHLLFLSAPIFLSNAYLADSSGRTVATQVMSYLAPDVDHIYFDVDRRSSVWEVGRANRPPAVGVPPAPERDSLLREVFKRPALAAAWYLLLGTVLTFVLFSAKRLQRIVPVVQPRRNTTLAYLGNVSRLYLARPNNALMARKQLGLFEAFCVRKFGLRPVHDAGDRQQLAALTGVDPKLTSALERYAASVSPGGTGLTNDSFLRLVHILRSLYQQLGRRSTAPTPSPRPDPG